MTSGVSTTTEDSYGAQLEGLTGDNDLFVVALQVYCSALTSLREAAQPLLPALVTPCVTLFQAHQHPPCLDVLTSCVLYFGAAPAAANLLTHALYVACSASEPVFQVTHALIFFGS